MELSAKVIEQMSKQEGCQSILHRPVRECIEEYGLEAARDAIEWFSMIISRELAEEYARVHLHKKVETNNDAVDQIHAA